MYFGDCDVCGKKNVKLYWTRHFMNLQLCRDCFSASSFSEDEEAISRQIRLSIAKLLRQIRRDEGRKEAIRVYDRLRGTGVPQNPRRLS